MTKRQSDPLLVNQRTIAAVFGVSPSTILNWVEMPSRKQGRERLYHIPTCVQWLWEKERQKLSSLSEEQALYTKTRRERQELLLAKERGDLIPMVDAKQVLTTLGLHLKGQLESLSHRLAGRLAGMQTTREISNLLKAEVAAVLSSFKSMKLE